MNNIPEVNNLPEDVKEKMFKEMSISFSSTRMGRTVPFESIMTPEHLSALIENTDKDSVRELENEKSNKMYIFLIFIFTLIFVIVLILLLIDKNPNVLMSIISHAGCAILGIAGGYGLKCKREE